MTRLDTETTTYIDDLRRQRDEADTRHRETQALLRAGLRATREGASHARIEAALTGTDVSEGT